MLSLVLKESVGLHLGTRQHFAYSMEIKEKNNLMHIMSCHIYNIRKRLEMFICLFTIILLESGSRSQNELSQNNRI
jgi:hypothetical protein